MPTNAITLISLVITELRFLIQVAMLYQLRNPGVALVVCCVVRRCPSLLRMKH